MKYLPSVLLMALAFLVTACSPGANAPSGPQEVTVTARDIAYNTERIEVTAGQPVELTLRNEGALEHDFSVMHFAAEMSDMSGAEEDGHDMGHMEEMPELHVSAKPGESSMLSFTPEEAGEYTFFCTVPGHQEAGMSGTLVVAAP